jgi:23S rRNA (cytidine2498-2'-O)-methyltransferase
VPDFAFATCLPGNEPGVKREVARTRPELRFAYSRPGLLTFRAPGELTADDASGSVFARVWGRSVGAARDATEASAQLATLQPQRVHVFLRDPDGDAALLEPWRALAGTDESRDEMTKVYSIAPGGEAQLGELVADVIVGPQGEPAWIGAHRHVAGLPPTAGGVEPARVPEDSPSRAFAKIEEAIAWAKLPVKAGQVALEIGAAPGGAVLALARRGLEVWACDTGDLAPNVAATKGVHHLAKKVGAVRWEELPPRIDWLLCDVNLAPQVALHELARLMPKLRPTLKGAVITLKMNDWAFVDELPKLVDRIKEMGLPNVRLRHLPANRREVCAVALP